MTYNLTSIAQRLKRRMEALPKSFVPFLVNGERIGWIGPEMANELKRWPSVFQIDELGVLLSSKFVDCTQRTEVMGQIAKHLYCEGWFKGWRNELVTVQSGKLSLLSIERATLRRFGITLHSAHLNGIYLQKKPEMWLAQRSKTKAVDPGCYDTLVGGGLGNGLEVMETLIKESWEEAGIAPEVAAEAERKSIVRVGRLVDEGWHDEIIYTHDLILPTDFRPQNNDGEVSAFQRFTLDEVTSMLMESDNLTVEASFVVCDYLLRVGHLRNGHSYRELHDLVYQ